MSQVRMCDKCGTVFSELEDGWQAFTATTVKRSAESESLEIRQAMDACPACSIVPKPQFERELKAVQEGKQIEARIAKLERETGMDQESGTFTQP